MKALLAYGLAFLIAVAVEGWTVAAAVTPREPAVDSTGRINGPFTGIAQEVEDHPGLIRIYLAGSGDANSRVTSGLVVRKGGRTVLAVPLAASEHNRVNPSPAKDWSIEVWLTRELAEDAEISLYLFQADAPSDSGQAFTIRVNRLLPTATTQPEEQR